MVYVDDLDINSYADLFYMPGQFNSFHTEENKINPYFGPMSDEDLYMHPLTDATGEWERLGNQMKNGLAKNPDWSKEANEENNALPSQHPFLSYSNRPGNMPNLDMFGANGIMNGTQTDGVDFVIKQPGMIAIVIKQVKRMSSIIVIVIMVIAFIKIINSRK